MKFKVGDKVRIVKITDRSLIHNNKPLPEKMVGQECIIKIATESNKSYHVAYVDSGEKLADCFECELEIIIPNWEKRLR